LVGGEGCGEREGEIGRVEVLGVGEGGSCGGGVSFWEFFGLEGGGVVSMAEWEVEQDMVR